MKYPKYIFIVGLAMLLLTACSPTKVQAKNTNEEPTSTGFSTPKAGKTGTYTLNESTDPTTIPTQILKSQTDLSKIDSQGSVTVKINPLNLDKPDDTLVFDVSMETHSVELNMELAQLSVLSTDTGRTVQAIQWDAPRGGHHVEGRLTFPATLDGNRVLAGARSIKIVIKDVDAPTRIFTWEITK